jgi:hypothetical protein
VLFLPFQEFHSLLPLPRNLKSKATGAPPPPSQTHLAGGQQRKGGGRGLTIRPARYWGLHTTDIMQQAGLTWAHHREPGSPPTPPHVPTKGEPPPCLLLLDLHLPSSFYKSILSHLRQGQNLEAGALSTLEPFPGLVGSFCTQLNLTPFLGAPPLLSWSSVHLSSSNFTLSPASSSPCTPGASFCPHIHCSPSTEPNPSSPAHHHHMHRGVTAHKT